MNYFFQIFFGKRPELKIEIIFTAHTEICAAGELKAILGNNLTSLV